MKGEVSMVLSGSFLAGADLTTALLGCGWPKVFLSFPSCGRASQILLQLANLVVDFFEGFLLANLHGRVVSSIGPSVCLAENDKGLCPETLLAA
jgi:hypothetical protein